MMNDDKKNAPDFDELKSLPLWVRDCLRDFLDQHDEIFQLTHLAWSGIALLPRIPPLIEALGDDASSAWSATEAQRIAELAERELRSGLPLLHAQAAIATWSTLECFVKAVARGWVAHMPQALEVEAVRKIKIPLAEYSQMTSDVRISYLVETLERDLRVGDGEGLGGFERLLGALELGGGVPDRIRDELHELKCVRNVLVHRRGIADEKFVKSLPRKCYSVGTKILVKHCCFAAYLNAAAGYATEVLLRIAAKCGVNREALAHSLRTVARRDSGHDQWPPGELAESREHSHDETA